MTTIYVNGVAGTLYTAGGKWPATTGSSPFQAAYVGPAGYYNVTHDYGSTISIYLYRADRTCNAPNLALRAGCDTRSDCRDHDWSCNSFYGTIPVGGRSIGFNAGTAVIVFGGQQFFFWFGPSYPYVNADFIAAPPTIKTGQYVKFINGTTPSSGITYAWDFGDTGTSTDAEPFHQYNSAGTYNVTLVAKNTYSGLTSSKTRTACVTVTDVQPPLPPGPPYGPTAAFSGAPTSGAGPLDVTFTDASTNTPTAWFWNFGDGSAISTSQNPTHKYAAVGTYSVTLQVGNAVGGSTLTKTGYITVTNPVAFSGTPLTGTEPLSVTFTDASVNSPSGWSWTFGDGKTSTDQNPTNIYDHDGTYSVTLECTYPSSGGTYTLTKTSYVKVSGSIPTPPDPPGPPVFILSNSSDGTITFQLNSSTAAEDAGSQYEYLMKLRETTNYDLRTRPDTYLYPYTSFDPDTMIITNSGASWTANEWADCWVLFVGQSANGVQTYGVVDSNDGTTITCSAMTGELNAAATGYILIYKGYAVDFVPDVSQPSVVRNLDVNKDCFEYSDNDDKKKLSTKVVVTGKDLFGKSISVKLAAVHKYDNTAQMFEDATMIVSRSEGYVYKNTFVQNYVDVTVDYTSAQPMNFTNDFSEFTDGTCVTVTCTTTPTGLTDGALYWVKSATATGCDLAYTGPGGTSVTLSNNGSGVKMYVVGNIQNAQTAGGTLPYVWLYGWGYTIPASSTMALVVPNGTATGVTSSGATYETTAEDGTQVTRVKLTHMPLGSMDFSGRGYLLNQRLYVQDYTKVGNNEVLIGEEKITIDSSGNDTSYGNYIEFADVTARLTSSTLKAYPHDVGALVARTNYTETSPQTDSAYADPADGGYGARIGNFTVDGNVTYGQLDQYATYMLLGLGNFYRKATTWSPLVYGYVQQVGEYHGGAQVNRSRPVAVGDRISVTTYSGDTPIEYEVVEVTIDHDKHAISYQLGDYEKNVFTSLEQKTNAINRTLT